MVLNTKIIDNKHTIWFDVDSKLHDVKYIYLDLYKNRNFYQSPLDGEHSYRFDGYDIIKSKTFARSEYAIAADRIGEKRINGLYILTVIFDDGSIDRRIIYDLNELYCLRVKYLTKSCVSCDDKANFKMLTILMFREMLLRNAVNLNMIDESLNYYSDIFRPFCDEFDTKVVTSCCGNKYR